MMTIKQFTAQEGYVQVKSPDGENLLRKKDSFLAIVIAWLLGNGERA